MKNADIFKLVFMAVYATLVTTASFFFFFQIVFGKIPEDNQQYANLILGFLIGSGIPTFLGYYYGMSQSTGKAQEKVPPPTEYTQTTTETITASKTDLKDAKADVESKTDKTAGDPS